MRPSVAEQVARQQDNLARHTRVTPVAIAVYAAAMTERMPGLAPACAKEAFELAEVFDEERQRRRMEANR